MFSKDIGIDLGTANTLIYVKEKGIVAREPSIVAINVHTLEIIAVGNQAKNMIGRTPKSITTIRPLKDGVISDFDIASEMISFFIKNNTHNFLFSRPRLVICIPSGVTEVERRAVENAAQQAGAGFVVLIEESIAAALGAGLPADLPIGNMIVDIGGGTSEIAVVSLGDIVISRSLRVAGDKFDQAIIMSIKENHNLIIGEGTAENIKIAIGSMTPYEDEIIIKGRDFTTGLPKDTMVKSDEIRIALQKPILEIINSIREVLSQTPPELSADIFERGIYISGGGAMLKGLEDMIANETKIPVKLVDEPLDCVAKGTGKALNFVFSKE
ncbi:MAG: rod shape-determining protein [Oscillospiraceae bacterium]|jgi:rod shape-determining protein MreB|nr:rod shape-determining protein [Oscillospiraceae bacterium]